MYNEPVTPEKPEKQPEHPYRPEEPTQPTPAGKVQDYYGISKDEASKNVKDLYSPSTGQEGI